MHKVLVKIQIHYQLVRQEQQTATHFVQRIEKQCGKKLVDKLIFPHCLSILNQVSLQFPFQPTNKMCQPIISMTHEVESIAYF